MGRNLFAIFSLLVCFSVGTAQQFQSKNTESLAKAESSKFSNYTANYQENVDLQFAHLQLQLDPRKHWIEGSVQFSFQLLENTTTISFDLDTSLQVIAVIHQNDSLAFTHTNQTLVTQFSSELSQNLTDTVEIFYEGSPSKNQRSGFVTSQRYAGDFALYTISQPYGAKDWWPVRQALGDRLDSVAVTVTVPTDYKGISNGLISHTQTIDTLTTTTWKHQYSIPPYLVAVAVGEYQTFQDSIHLAHDTLPYVNHLFNDQIDRLPEFDQLKSMMRLFEKIAGEYPYLKEQYGHTMWERGGGMEHTTNSFMGNFSWELQAHELAHMWFGDLVTCASWQDIWLNEGFASYYTGITYEFIPEVRKYWSIWKAAQIASITKESGGSVYVYDTTEVSRVFNSRLTYRKASYVIHMLRWQTDTVAFFDYMNSWLFHPDRKFGFANTQDFQNHLENESGKDLSTFFNQWIYQQGFPSYQVFWEQDALQNFKIEVHQTTSHPSVSFFEMKVPIRVYSATGDSTDVVVNHTYSGQEFSQNIPFTIDSVAFDPDLWLLSNNNRVVPTQYKNQLRVYPNPSNDFINIEFMGTVGTINSVELTHINGQTVRSIPSTSLSFVQLDVRNVASGTYELIVETGAGRKQQTVIIY